MRFFLMSVFARLKTFPFNNNLNSVVIVSDRLSTEYSKILKGFEIRRQALPYCLDLITWGLVKRSERVLTWSGKILVLHLVTVAKCS